MERDLDLKELNTWLNQFLNFEKLPDTSALKLSTMRTLCAHFQHPESNYKCIHVAGSKGKGTIAANIAAILGVNGYQTGVYSSPHVLHFTERITMDGAQPFSQAVYDQAFLELRAGVEQLIADGKINPQILTWFELVTLFGMLVFRAAKVDFAIFEVGMGGRLDATNVILPECIAMGPIELEHTQYLGSTLSQIATEKAGTFKERTPIVSAPQRPEVVKVFEELAKAKHSPLLFVPAADYQTVDRNVAKLAVQQFIPDADLKDDALMQVRLPGRYEIIQNLPNYLTLPYLLIDVAHTAKSISAVLARLKKDGKAGNLLFGCAADKNVEEMARLIVGSGLFQQIYLTKPGDFKKSDLARMQQAFSQAGAKGIKASEDFQNFIPQVLAQSSKDGAPLIVLGSFYLAGEVKKRCE